MTSSCIAEQRCRLRKYGRPSRCGCRNVGWSYIRRRRKPSIVRMMIEEERILRRSLLFWGTRFVPDARRTRRMGNSSSTSARRLLRKQARPYETRFDAGSCQSAATSRSMIYPACSTRRSGAGSSITGGTIARRFIPSYNI